MTNIKTLFLGAAVALAGVLAGEGLAHADCDYQPAGYTQARSEADACETNYGEVVRVSGGFVAYCVPNDIAEGCIDVSSLLDCSLLSAGSCDEAMGRMFEACLTLQAGTR